MTRKPVVRSRDKSPLLAAVEHVYNACQGAADYAPYCLFSPGWLIGYDGVVAGGYRIAEQLTVAPHAETLRAALARAGSPYSLTVLANQSLAVRGDKVRVECPTYPPDAIPNAQPDAALVPITETLAKTLIDVGRVAVTKSERIYVSSVLVRDKTCVATNGNTILEGWHGNDLPSQWLLPKEFIDALEKMKYLPTHMGWGETTFTVWFGPHAWLRTNVYDAKYPDTDVMFASMIADCGAMHPIPPDALLALDTLKPFLSEPFVQLRKYGFNTSKDDTGATYSFEHSWPVERQLPFTGIRHAALHGQLIGFCDAGLYWHGNVIRGITAAQE